VLCVEPSSRLYKTSELSEVWKKVDQVLLHGALSIVLFYSAFVTHQYSLHYLHSFLYNVEKGDENGIHVISFAVVSIATSFFFFYKHKHSFYIVSFSSHVQCLENFVKCSTSWLWSWESVASIVTALQDGHSKI
jgi:hypothetical protein